MKMKILLTLFLTAFTLNVNAQWQTKWSSTALNYYTASGWIDFEKNGNTWLKRLYLVDSTKFVITTGYYSQNPQYTYNFTAAEKLAGSLIYSTGYDFTGDNRVEFYVLSWYGTTSNYRQSFKIIDIVSNSIVFERNVSNAWYSSPTFSDLDGDGKIECSVIRYYYPFTLDYFIEVYATGATGIANEGLPAKFELKQNYPNPFNPTTKIDFNIENPDFISLEIFNISGEKISTLRNEYMDAGNHSVVWDGKNGRNETLPTGVYFYRLSGTKLSENKKMILLK